MLAALFERSEDDALAGVMYGLATAMKIQIGLPFLAYVIWRRRWRTAAFAVAVIAALTIISVLRMEAAGLPWFASWTANLDLLTRPGALNDPGTLNPERYSLINLQFPLASIGVDGFSGLAVVVGAVGLAGLSLVYLIRDRRPRQELLALSVVAVLGLLVTYHRYYDAVLLAFPIAWACTSLSTARRKQAVIVLVLCADFIIPVQTNLRELQLAGHFPAWLTDNVVWDAVVLGQQVWALCLMVLVLLWAAADEHRDDKVAASSVGPSPEPGTQALVATGTSGTS